MWNFPIRLCETIEHFRNQVFGMMRRVNPGIKQRELGVIEVSGKRIAYVEFSNPAMDGKLYNLMFYMESGGSFGKADRVCGIFQSGYGRKAVQSDVLYGVRGQTADGKL